MSASAKITTSQEWSDTMCRQITEPYDPVVARAASRQAARTFRSLAAGYAEWAAEGGPDAPKWQREHERLIDLAEWHERFGAEPETEHEAA